MCPDSNGSVEGRPIDLDNAKHTDTMIAPLLALIRSNPATTSDILDVSNHPLTRVFKKEVPDGIAGVLKILDVPTTTYARALLDYNPKLKDLAAVSLFLNRRHLYLHSSQISGKDLGFLDPVSFYFRMSLLHLIELNQDAKVPDFSIRTARDSHRSVSISAIAIMIVLSLTFTCRQHPHLPVRKFWIRCRCSHGQVPHLR